LNEKSKEFDQHLTKMVKYYMEIKDHQELMKEQIDSADYIITVNLHHHYREHLSNYFRLKKQNFRD
jgi:uncharacterized protein with ACT and thioredoxin-like domain